MALFALIIVLAFIALFVIFHDFTNSFLGVIAIFILAWFLWYTTGGVERFEKSNQGMFIKPTNNYQDFETYGKFPEIKLNKESN